MKYQAKPVIVTAHKITEIRGRDENGNVFLTLEDGQMVEALPDMTARMNPKLGDYWVVTEDGYTYLNPAKVFEAKYEALETVFAKVDSVQASGEADAPSFKKEKKNAGK